MISRIVVGGKRKTAVARAMIVSGSGKLFYNGLNYESLPFFQRISLKEPLAIAHNALGKVDADIYVKTRGGGHEGQIQAARLAISKALVVFSKSQELRKVYVKYDRSLVVADTRRKETYKTGDSKARAKRQKSYR